ncbi:hypothetical protein IWQ62_001626 [Dispira parvispora]|uniref:Uncharacterized protein n=1 Tax=Dispira parvispora TaxID=1520584 RepID=A0A9W8AXX1_9FUNG|nr:hypothetical protein IWQ62_001626 [Dispira parvispora]
MPPKCPYTSAEGTRCPFTPEELRIYQKFSTYPWNEDQCFQAGLQKVREGLEPPATDISPDDLNHLKVHYFAKSFQPFDPQKLELWQQYLVQQDSSKGSKGSDQLEVFQRFENYEFSQDQQFLSVLQHILAEMRLPADQWLNSAEFDDALLQCKLVYYNKHVESINTQHYLTWRQHRRSDKNEGPTCPMAYVQPRTPEDANLPGDHDILEHELIGVTHNFRFTSQFIGHGRWTLPWLAGIYQKVETNAALIAQGKIATVIGANDLTHLKSMSPPALLAQSGLNHDYFAVQPGLSFEEITAEYYANRQQHPEWTPQKCLQECQAPYLDLLATFYQILVKFSKSATPVCCLYILDGLCHRSTIAMESFQDYILGTENTRLTFSPFGDHAFPWVPISGLFMLSRLRFFATGDPLDSVQSPEKSGSPTPPNLTETDASTGTEAFISPLVSDGMAILLLFWRDLVLRGPELLQLNFINAFIPSRKVNSLRRKLLLVTAGGPKNRDITVRLAFESERVYAGPSKLGAIREDVQRCFGNHATGAHAMKELEGLKWGWAQSCLREIQYNSPMLLMIIVRGIRMASSMNLVESLRLEYYIAQKFSQMPDFHIYLETQRNSAEPDYDHPPHWQHRSLSDITPQMVDEFYADFDREKENFELFQIPKPTGTSKPNEGSGIPRETNPDGAYSTPQESQSQSTPRRCPFTSSS